MWGLIEYFAFLQYLIFLSLVSFACWMVFRIVKAIEKFVSVYEKKNNL